MRFASLLMAVMIALLPIADTKALGSVGVAGAFQMEGVAGFIEGRAREALKVAMSEKGTEWMAEAIAKVLNQSRDGKSKKTDWNKIFYQDAETRRLVEAELKEKIKEWLPGAVKDLIVQNIFAGIAGEEALEEAKSIADRVVKEMNTSFNERVDDVVGGWYDSTVASIRNRVTGAGVPEWVDITDIKKTIGSAFDLGNIGDMVASQMGGIIGDAAVTGIRGRIEDALNGELPREAVDAIKRGPEEFDKYVRQAEKYLPGNQLRKLTDSILNRPLIKIPTPAYASMLAASAAGHFARAYDGVVVNPEEIKRGIEVTRVMIWQLQNKEWMNLSIMQIANIARNIAVNFDAGQALGGAMSKIKEPIEKLQGHLDRLDRMIMKPIKDIQKQMKEITDELQKELLELQEKLVRPVRENIERIDAGLTEAGGVFSGLIPDTLNGIPENWEELKKRFGLEDGVLGKWGDKTPKDILKDAAKGLGLDKAGKKIKEDLSKLNDAVAGKIAKGAGGLLSAVHLLGPTAAILGIEKVPPRNESKSKELDPVLLHTGEFESEVTDVVIPGRGIDFRFMRTYMSLGNFLGEFGWGWTHSYAERLLPWNGGLTYIDEGGRKFFFKETEDGYVPPKGLYLKLSRVEGGYELQGNDGGVTQFDSSGRPVEKRDRHGNSIKYIYNDTGLLGSIVDAYGREIKFERRPDGLISALKDFAGRTFTYQYNDELELIGVRTPATPDFPKGKLTAYRYDANTNYHSMTMIMDPNGRVYLKNRYDEEGRVAAQSYGEGPWMTVAYGKGGEGETVATRAWVTDALGTMRLYENDSEGRLLNLWRWDGEKYHLIERNLYDENGERTAECMPSGRCRFFSYKNGDLVNVEDYGTQNDGVRILPVERDDAFNRPNLTRSAAGQIVSETDERGEVTSYEYYPACDPDGDGVKIAGCVMDGGGYASKILRGETFKYFEYDPIGNITAVTNERGQKTVYSVNALNQITKEEEAGLAQRRYFFDANDNLRKVAIEMHGRTAVHEFEYDVLDRPTLKKFEIAPGKYLETRYEYDYAGNLKRVIHPEGNADDYEYGPDGRLMCVTRGSNSPERSRECVERNEDGEVAAFIDGDGFRIKFQLNGFGEVVGETDPLGNRAEFERDGKGRVISRRNFDSTGSLLAESKFEYDADGRMTVEKKRLWRDDPEKSSWVEERFDGEERPEEAGKNQADKSKWKYSYDGMGNLISVTDPLGVETALDYDYIGRPASIVRDANGLRLTTRYEWNGNGGLTKITGPDGDDTNFTYDALDRLVAERHSNGTEYFTAYDRRNLVTWATDANGSILAMKYDALGRLVSRNGRPSAGVIGSASQKFKYDGLGRIIEADDDGWITRFIYDSLSRPTAEEQGGRRLGREYDDRGNVVVLEMPSGAKFYFSYDREGSVDSIMHDSRRIAAIERDEEGDISRELLGENLFLEIERDQEGLEHRRQYITNKGEWQAATEAFYDEMGRVSHVTGYAGIDRFYKRDAVGRLVESFDETGGHDEEGMIARQWKYAYSADGRRKKAGEVMRDAAGNMISDGRREYRYDIFGRLSGIWEGERQIAEYKYDAFDRRVAKNVDGRVQNALWNGWLLAEESADDGQSIDYVYAGSAYPIAAVSGKDVNYLFSDRMGSVIATAAADGQVLSRCNFDPYGSRIPVMPPVVDEDFVDCGAYKYAFGFAGGIEDRESGLIYMRERYYDPRSGEFITPDPLGFKVSLSREGVIADAPVVSYHARQGGASRATYPNRPLEISEFYTAYPFGRAYFADERPFMYGETNLYVYAADDPSSFVDPLGLARLLFDRSDEKIMLIDGGWTVRGTYSAANFVTRPKSNPLAPKMNGPFPNGTFSLGVPEFYSKKYRDIIISKYELGDIAPWEGLVNGKYWNRETRGKEPDYHAAFGSLRIRAGGGGTWENRRVFARALFLHGGRHNYKKETYGCVRVDDSDMEKLAVDFINLQREGDPINSITVQD